MNSNVLILCLMSSWAPNDVNGSYTGESDEIVMVRNEQVDVTDEEVYARRSLNKRKFWWAIGIGVTTLVIVGTLFRMMQGKKKRELEKYWDLSRGMNNIKVEIDDIYDKYALEMQRAYDMEQLQLVIGGSMIGEYIPNRANPVRLEFTMREIRDINNNIDDVPRIYMFRGNKRLSEDEGYHLFDFWQIRPWLTERDNNPQDEHNFNRQMCPLCKYMRDKAWSELTEKEQKEYVKGNLYQDMIEQVNAEMQKKRDLSVLNEKIKLGVVTRKEGASVIELFGCYVPVLASDLDLTTGESHRVQVGMKNKAEVIPVLLQLYGLYKWWSEKMIEAERFNERDRIRRMNERDAWLIEQGEK